MRAGIQVFNEAGYIQIDDRFVNYQLSEKVSKVSGAVSGPVNGGPRFNSPGVMFRVSDLSSISAISANNKFSLGYINSVSLSEYEIGVAAPAGTIITMYRFLAGAPADTGSGMQIFDDSTPPRLVFDAGSKFLRVVGKTAAFADTSATSWTLTPGRNYALVFGRWSGSVMQSSYPGPVPDMWIVQRNWYSPIWYTSSPGSISANHAEVYNDFEFPLTGGKPPDSFINYIGGDILFADVTNY